MQEIAVLVERGMDVVTRILEAKAEERESLYQRFYEWAHHPLAHWQTNMDIFNAGYRLGLRGAHRLEEPYWHEVPDEDGTYTQGPS